MGIYGATGTGKTSQIERVIDWYATRIGWKSGDLPFCRFATADSTMAPLAKWIRAGAVEVLDLSELVLGRKLGDLQLATMATLSGYWPGPDKTKLMPPASVHPKNLQIFAFEGISELADMLFNEQVEQGRKVSEEVVGLYHVEDSTLIPGYKYSTGAGGRSHYGHIQNEILKAIKTKLTALPYRYILASFHEGKGKDEITGVQTLGPKLPGQAAGNRVGQKFAHFVHLDLVYPGAGKAPEYCAFWRPHPENPAQPSSPTWGAKLSFDLYTTSAWTRKYPQGHIPLVLDGWDPKDPKGSIADILHVGADPVEVPK